MAIVTIMFLRQKQLTFCPSFDLAASGDTIVLVKASTKQRAFVWDFFFKYSWSSLPTPRDPEFPLENASTRSGKWWVIWKHVFRSLLHDRQCPTLLDFLEEGVIKMWQLAVCAVAVITPWRLFYNKFVFVWNKNIHSWVRCENLDAPSNVTRLLLDVPTTFGNEVVTRNATRWLLEIPTRICKWGHN